MFQASTSQSISGVLSSICWKLTRSIREEMGKQKLLQELTVAREKKLQKEQAERIEKRTNGKLKFGMTLKEVEAVLGRPIE